MKTNMTFQMWSLAEPGAHGMAALTSQLAASESGERMHGF